MVWVVSTSRKEPRTTRNAAAPVRPCGQREQQPYRQTKGDCAEQHIRFTPPPAGAGAVRKVTNEGIVDGVPGEFTDQQSGSN